MGWQLVQKLLEDAEADEILSLLFLWYNICCKVVSTFKNLS